MDGARDVLSWGQEAELSSLSIPIRERNAFVILRIWVWNLFLQRFLTSQSGFARKPDPEAAMYLMEKYGLEPEIPTILGIGAWILTLQEIARFIVSIS